MVGQSRTAYDPKGAILINPLLNALNKYRVTKGEAEHRLIKKILRLDRQGQPSMEILQSFSPKQKDFLLKDLAKTPKMALYCLAVVIAKQKSLSSMTFNALTGLAVDIGIDIGLLKNQDYKCRLETH